ncbi:MAG TPA: cytochrome c [Solirubrobacteraceae bacterium]|jgi:mono/diheme cytochrome c family protein|nr:cytochrome c [Solirubrobacteraceae bacterium]
MVAAAASVLLGISGCSLKHPSANIVAGKALFVAKCGACHTLRRAGTTTDIGPNLDDAFAQDRADGVKSTSIQGLIDYWIQYPDTEGVMPADLYKGQQAQNVAAYVAAVAARPGVDSGQLAQAGAVTGTTAAAGKQVFTGPGGCGSCHTLAAAGSTGTVGPNLDARLRSDCASAASKKIRGATLADCIKTAIIKPYAYLPSGYPANVMPSDFSTKLKPNEITALVNFLSSEAK